MCLLDEVLEWDAGRIRCRASSHRAQNNPLRAHGRLGAACGVEYAAQAMAIHGALLAEATAVAGPRVGYLASVRSVSLFAERLDDVQSDLIATASRMTSDSATVLYEFSVGSAERILLNGRATIVFAP
jgi:predicted hotdog family 3-hydroxylacyl-ACP dehydratase